MRPWLSALLALAAPLLCSAVAAAQPAPFDPDPQHLWNRLERQIYEPAGPDRPIPLGVMEPRALLEGEAHRQALALLDEFLKGGDRAIPDPLKRAILQHDLWGVFGVTTGPAREVLHETAEGRLLHTGRFQDPGDREEERRAPRRELQKRLVQALRRLALSADEIDALPDNLAAAVRSEAFPKEYDAKHGERSFLPADLLAADGPWVAVANPTQPEAMPAPMHLAENRGRAAFSAFLSLPEGRKATEAYANKLGEGKLDQLPKGARTALWERRLLIDKDGRLRQSPLTRSVQFRVYPDGGVNDGVPLAFELDRADLFAGRNGGLHVLREDRGNNQSDVEKRLPPTVLVRTCTSCHARINATGVYSIATLFSGDRDHPGLTPTTAKEQSKSTIGWVQKTYTWGLLQGLWEAQPSP
jgi:hypothetical protein